MALSLDSKIKDIMRSPEGKAVMEKWAPGSSKDPRMKLVGALTYRKLLSKPSDQHRSHQHALLPQQIQDSSKVYGRSAHPPVSCGDPWKSREPIFP